LKEPTISIRFAHPEAATAMNVANAVAAVIKERLESQQQKLRMDILAQEDAVEDKRKLLESILANEADNAVASQNEKDGWRCPIGYQSPIDAKADLEQGLRKLEELKAKPVFSIGSIRAAKLTSD